jgi:4-amino-4-deoxy-L-arabinose transferase-like glycosyltransferase
MKKLQFSSWQRHNLPYRSLSIILTLVACSLMIASAFFFRPETNRQFITEATLSFFAGGLALGGALWLSNDRLETLTPSSAILTPAHSRWWIVSLGIVLLALVSESSGRGFPIPALANLSVHNQFALLVAGVVMVGWGIAGEIRFNFSAIEPQTVFLLGGITLIGLVVRVWGLDITARFMQDETVFTDALMHFWQGGNPGLLNGGGLFTVTMVYPYWNAGTVELFGRNLVGLRMASALLGVLAIPVAYGLTSALFDRKLGLIAALFVATFPPHVHFSRISWGHMGDALFGLMALMFAVRAMKWNRRADWAFAGVSLALTQYFYEMGRLLYPPLLVVWFVLLVSIWKMKPYRGGILLGLLAATLVAAPVYYAIAVRGMSFTPRVDDSAIGMNYWIDLFEAGLDDGERQQILGRLATPFLVYTHHPDSLAEYYGGFAGFVPPQLVPLFLLGVFRAIWGVRYPAFVLVMALLLVSSANVFAKDGGIAARYVMIAPIIPILMAVGLYSVLHLLSLDRRSLLLVGLTVLVAVWQIYFYFGIHLPYYNEQRRWRIPERDIFDAVLQTPNLPPDTEVFLIDPAPSIDYGRANRLYLFLQDSRYLLQAPTTSDFDPMMLPHDHNYAFFIASDDSVTLARIRRAFPDIQPPQYTTYPIPEWDQYILLLWLKHDE